MKKSLAFISLFLFAFAACDCEESPEQTCGTLNPTEDLAWLKTAIESWDQYKSEDYYTFMYVQQGMYRGQQIFLFGNCCPFCNTTVPIYNCEGELLWYAGSEPEKTEKITDLKVIWKPDGFQCTI